MIVEEDDADLAAWQRFVAGKPVESRGFCPTGPGGGIDNSCGKEGGGGGEKYAKGDPMKRRDIKPGQRISITKHGQKTTRTGTVESVTHGDKESEITLKDENGNVTKVKIRDLAAITDQAGEVTPTGQEAKPSGVKGTRPDAKNFNVDAQGRKQFRAAVAEFCKANGVTLQGAYGDISGEGSASISSLKEVAAGVEKCIREGVPLPPIIKLFTPRGIDDAKTYGYYRPGEPNAIHINSQLAPGVVEMSAKSGWTVNTGRPDGNEGLVVIHEAAHALHDKVLRSDGGNTKHGLVSMSTEPLKGAIAKSVRDHISMYATTEPAEFVAEMFTAHTVGRQMPKKLWKLYRQYGGPTPPGGFP